MFTDGENHDAHRRSAWRKTVLLHYKKNRPPSRSLTARSGWIGLAIERSQKYGIKVSANFTLLALIKTYSCKEEVERITAECIFN